jgi:hypothetical protein
MYRKLSEFELKSGQRVEAGVVIAPDADWSERLKDFLSWQDDIWNWQNSIFLESQTGIEVYYYVAHADGQVVSTIMSAECNGIGLRGHIWTPPELRRNGACAPLHGLQLKDFHSRGGKFFAAYTDFNSAAWHMYTRAGLRPSEPFGGHVSFENPDAELPSPHAETVIEALNWQNWATSAPLFMGRQAPLVRCAPLGLVGRRTSEYELLLELRNQLEGGAERVRVMRNLASQEVVGLAAWVWHPGLRDVCLLDVYCFPDYWDQAGALLDALELPSAHRYIAYSEHNCPEKSRCLEARGFSSSGSWRRYPVDLCRPPTWHLPASGSRSMLARLAWRIGHPVDHAVAWFWRHATHALNVDARVPARWPRFPHTRALFADLELYER